MIMRTITSTISLLLLLAVGTARELHAQGRTIVIRGSVTNEEGAPLAIATIQAAGTGHGSLSDRAGRFLFAMQASSAGARVEIIARFVGYETERVAIDLSRGDTITLDIVMRKEILPLKGVTVSASSYGMEDGAHQAAMRPLDVVTTPGAAADIFRAMQTIPGVSALEDGSGLFVRGGDVEETVIMLDQATVVHPYRYESPGGGAFGTIPPFLVNGIFFSTGGFPARYGNALSGALVMESMNMPGEWSVNANLGLAAASLGVAAPVVPDRLGVRFSGNRTSTDLLLRLNGRLDEFTTAPSGIDANGSVIYDYGSSGRLKLFNFATKEEIGVRVRLPSTNGIYSGEEKNRLHNLQWREMLEGWLLRGSLSINSFEGRTLLGGLDLTRGDDTYKARFDAEREVGESDTPWLRILCGAEMERTENRIAGTIPINPNVLDTAAPRYELDEEYDATRSGGYLEAEMRAAPGILVGTGLRADHSSANRRVTFDPRLSLRYQFAEGANVRLAWGIYHQTPLPYQLNAASGNPDLRSQRSEHRIAGVEYSMGPLMARLELYDKRYRDLILRDSALHLVNRGDGYARGVDIFLKYGAFLETRFNGWLSYSFLSSRRTQPRDHGGPLTYEDAPSPFDITHNLMLVGKYRLIGFLNIGVGARYATGAPITPIAGAIFDSTQGTYTPIEGAIGSERLPAYIRLDCDLSYQLLFAENAQAIFYLGITNLLDRSNVLGYTYSNDYTTRTPRRTNFNRSTYFGATVTIAL